MPSDPSPRRATVGAARLLLAPVAAVSLGVALTACGSSSTSTASSSTTAASSTTASGATGTTAGGSSGTTATKKVSANTASKAELEAALTANGVKNASRWANEIEEYRPYPTDDPSLAQLRKELAKYNPSADQLELIMNSLEP